MGFMKNIPITKGRNPINSGLAIDSFRRMGFSTLSAICEIIDNSVEAEATKIQIIIDWNKKLLTQKYRRPERFVFIDNGHGMNKDILYDCLVIGESTRRALKKGIGKFGVGATFGGISQARHIEIYSKTKDGVWQFTQLDLDLLENGEGIMEPVKKDPPAKYGNELANQGTIVIWGKIDSDFNEKSLDHVKNSIGRTYRKFLTSTKLEDGKIIKNNPIKISLNSEPISPYDPLYLTFNPKADDKDEPTFTSDEYDLKDGDLKSKMRITYSFLPDSWWKDPNLYRPGSDPINKDQRKITSDNAGISIVREGREMAFGEIPYLKLYSDEKSDMGASFAPEDRFVGVEISFGRDADEIFGIEANKSRMVLSPYARRRIGTLLRPILLGRREYFSRIRGEESKKSGHSGTKTAGGKSKKIIQEAISPPNYSEEEKQKVKKFVEQFASGKQEIEDYYNDLIKGYLPIHSWDLDPNGPFIRFEHHQKSIIVKYNMNHPFMKKLFKVLEDIAERKGEDPDNALNIEEIQRTKTLFDLLLASYGLAELTFQDPGHEEEIHTTLKTLMSSWGDIAHRISKVKIESG